MSQVKKRSNTASKRSDDKKNIILLSYPRSGNTAVRYFLEFVSGMASMGYGNKLDQPIIHKNLINSNHKIIKTHGNISASRWDKDRHQMSISSNLLIFLIRDPIECITRHYETKINSPVSGKIDNYFFENFFQFKKATCKKEIFYYEDMIKKPSFFYKRLGDFINADKNLVQEFLDNLKEHAKKSFSFYINSDEQQANLDNFSHLQLNRHRKKYSKEEIDDFFNYLRDQLGSSYSYLQRYYTD